MTNSSELVINVEFLNKLRAFMDVNEYILASQSYGDMDVLEAAYGPIQYEGDSFRDVMYEVVLRDGQLHASIVHLGDFDMNHEVCIADLADYDGKYTIEYRKYITGGPREKHKYTYATDRQHRSGAFTCTDSFEDALTFDTVEAAIEFANNKNKKGSTIIKVS